MWGTVYTVFFSSWRKLFDREVWEEPRVRSLLKRLKNSLNRSISTAKTRILLHIQQLEKGGRHFQSLQMQSFSFFWTSRCAPFCTRVTAVELWPVTDIHHVCHTKIPAAGRCVDHRFNPPRWRAGKSCPVKITLCHLGLQEKKKKVSLVFPRLSLHHAVFMRSRESLGGSRSWSFSSRPRPVLCFLQVGARLCVVVVPRGGEKQVARRLKYWWMMRNSCERLKLIQTDPPPPVLQSETQRGRHFIETTTLARFGRDSFHSDRPVVFLVVDRA